MKKKILILCIFIFLLGVMSVMLSSCSWIEDLKNKYGDKDPDTYTITYFVGAEEYTLEVRDGENYSLNKIPQRYGYIFMGLYDTETYGSSAEEGMFVNANGKSLMPFTDKCDMTLYPHFKAKTSGIVFNLQGAVGSSDFKPVIELPYGSVLTSGTFLSQYPEKENYRFTGWYTKPDCQGQLVIDDKDIVRVTELTNANFEFDDSMRIQLYAGFQLQDYEVTIYFDETSRKTVSVPYGTDIALFESLPELGGQIVIKWEKEEYGSWTEFNGVITQDMTLRVADSAYRIQFDVNGGSIVEDILAQEGEDISLPHTSRSFYKFMGWYDSQGAKFDSSVMPARSFTLQALWEKYYVTFNSAGGTELTDIAIDKNTVTLPVPKKSGCVFCGWYTDSGTFYYDSLQYDQQDVALTAKWTTAVIHNETDLWAQHVNTGDQNVDAGTYSKNIAIPAELQSAIQLGKIGVKVSTRQNCSVRSMGDATASASTSVVINGKALDGAQTSAKGGGYSWGNPKHGSWSEVTKVVADNIVLKNLNPITFSVSYKMTSNKQNDKVKIEAYYLCAQLTVELYNI